MSQGHRAQVTGAQYPPVSGRWYANRLTAEIMNCNRPEGSNGSGGKDFWEQVFW